MIVDDEPLALALLENYVLKTEFLQLNYRCKNAVQAKQIIKNTRIDVIFLDIHMPEFTGLEFSRLIDKETRIIFTTAFDQYALQGYKVNALDYLLKPFDYEEFLIAATKAKEWFEKVRKTIEPLKEYIYVRSEYKQVKIIFSEVLYFEGLKDYVKIWLKNIPKPVLTLMSLKTLENELPRLKFMRVHRSYIIALDKIEMIEKGSVLIGQKSIMIARPYKTDFNKFIEGN